MFCVGPQVPPGCVAVHKSRGWGADFPWLVHVLWARRGVGGGARTPVPRAGICVCVWLLGAPPPRSVAAPLRGRALSPLRLPSPWGLSGPAAHVLWARVCGYGVQHCPRGLYSLCSSGSGSRGFAACVSVVRGVCGQALPLPRLSAFWAGCGGPLATLAVGAGVRVWGPGALSSACMPCGGRAPRGWWGLSPGGLARHRCEGRLVSGAVPPPVARPLGVPSGSATHMLWARACGCGGPALSPRPACPVGAACPEGGGGRPRGGVACHRC